jgi:selenocysteine lyase/cysteine desulfurase
MQPLDLPFIRSHFPAFSDPDLEGWAFFNNAGGSYPCQQVVDRLTTFYRKYKIQPYGPYPAGQKGGAMMDEATVRLAGYFNVEPDEICFGPSTSQNSYVLAHALRPGWREGDEIIVTNQDHEANSGAWRRLAQTGLVVREWRIDPVSAELSLADLDALISERTRLIAFPHCSNLVGHFNPLREVADRAHAVGALAVADGVAAAPHGFPDIQASGIDIYLLSTYKTFGPHQGVMVVRRPVLDQVANQGHYFNAIYPGKRLTPAGPDHAQIAACAGIADYLDAVYAHHFAESADPPERSRRLLALFRAAERQLTQPLLAWLAQRDGVTLVGPGDAAVRAPTIALRTRKPADFLARELAEYRIMADAGHFYAVRVLDALAIPADPGILRLSFVHYTESAEIARLIEALDALL